MAKEKISIKFGMEFSGEEDVVLFREVREKVGERGFAPLIKQLLREWIEKNA